jgi:hypothetical protein
MILLGRVEIFRGRWGRVGVAARALSKRALYNLKVAAGWRRPTLLAVPLAALLAGAAVAEARYWTPKPGSAERTGVLDTARVPVERDLAQPVIFQVKVLRVSPDWAFVYGVPKRPDGKPVDYAKSIYAEDAKGDAFSGQVAVLLARDGSGWRLVTYSVGFTDVVWDSWDEEFGAPAWLWP